MKFNNPTVGWLLLYSFWGLLALAASELTTDTPTPTEPDVEEDTTDVFTTPSSTTEEVSTASPSDLEIEYSFPSTPTTVSVTPTTATPTPESIVTDTTNSSTDILDSDSDTNTPTITPDALVADSDTNTPTTSTAATVTTASSSTPLTTSSISNAITTDGSTDGTGLTTPSSESETENTTTSEIAGNARTTSTGRAASSTSSTSSRVLSVSTADINSSSSTSSKESTTGRAFSTTDDTGSVDGESGSSAESTPVGASSDGSSTNVALRDGSSTNVALRDGTSTNGASSDGTSTNDASSNGASTNVALRDGTSTNSALTGHTSPESISRTSSGDQESVSTNDKGSNTLRGTENLQGAATDSTQSTPSTTSAMAMFTVSGSDSESSVLTLELENALVQTAIALGVLGNDQLFADLESYLPDDSQQLSTLYSLINLRTKQFEDGKLLSSIADAFATIYTYLPLEAQTSVIPQITSITSSLNRRANYQSGLAAGIGLNTIESSAESYDTEVPQTTISLNSDLYILAQCYALGYDIGSFGAQYNDFFESFTDTSQLSSFYSAYVSYSGESVPAVYNEMCQTIVPFLQLFPWKPRVNAEAKLIFQEYYETLEETITIGSKVITPPPNPATSMMTGFIAATGTVYETMYYPFEIVFDATDSDGVSTKSTKTTTIPASSLTKAGNRGVQNRFFSNTGTITSKNENMITCGVEALIYKYYQNSNYFENFVEQHKTQPYIQSYTSLLNKFKKDNIMRSPQKRQEVMIGFYNFIFNLPESFKIELMDVMAYCYIVRQTATDGDLTRFHISDYQHKGFEPELFSAIFKFGNGTNYMEKVGGGSANESETGSSSFVTTNNREFYPVFPTSVNGIEDGQNGGIGDVLVDLRYGNDIGDVKQLDKVGGLF